MDRSRWIPQPGALSWLGLIPTFVGSISDYRCRRIRPDPPDRVGSVEVGDCHAKQQHHDYIGPGGLFCDKQTAVGRIEKTSEHLGSHQQAQDSTRGAKPVCDHAYHD